MPEKMTLHFKDGTSTAMDAIDARRVLREHAAEWATTPFPADVQKAAKEEAEALRRHLASLKAARKSDIDIEDARIAWPDTWAAMQAEKLKAAAPVKAFEAKHRGGGSYSVLDASGKEVIDKMTREDAETFNAMSVEDQAEYVKVNAKA